MHIAGLLVAFAAAVSVSEAATDAPVVPTPSTPCPTLPQPTTPCPTLPQPTTGAPVNGTCNILADKDRAGFDLANVQAMLADCATICEKTKGCVTYTWNNHNGGTCWLKSRAGDLIDKAGVSATDCVRDIPSLVCSPYQDIDFVGMDIANEPSKDAAGCCNVCNTFAGCTAYTWSNHNGGTCWLKKSVGHVIAKPGVVSSSLVSLWGPVCPFEYDTDFEANDIGNKPAEDAGVCCTLCKATAACKSYTWSNHNGGTCWMKSAKGKVIAAPGKISAKLAGF